MHGLTFCPDCKGEGELFGFGCPGFRPMMLACPRCKGSGEVPRIQLTWIKIGDRMKEVRFDHLITAREASKLLKMKWSLYSEYERGIRNPERTLKCLKLKLRKTNSQNS